MVVIAAFVGVASTFLFWFRLPFWSWLLGLLPSLLVAHHAMYLAWVKARSVPQRQDRPIRLTGTRLAEALGPAIESMVEESEQYFGASSLAIRFGIPALLNAVVGLTVVYVLYDQRDLLAWVQLPSDLGAHRGALGAYVYCVFHLGERNFQHDISSGCASWCAIQLAMGPLLGALVYYAWKPDSQSSAVPLTLQVASFLAGFAPRMVMRYADKAARRLFTSAQATATVPLLQIPGVTEAIEDRLNEEGIDDVHALAMASPIRLLRNTPFDKRQVVDLIDRAFLMVALPEHWRALQNMGIPGAIDLAWHSRQCSGDDPAPVEALKKVAELAHSRLFRPGRYRRQAVRRRPGQTDLGSVRNRQEREGWGRQPRRGEHARRFRRQARREVRRAREAGRADCCAKRRGRAGWQSLKDAGHDAKCGRQVKEVDDIRTWTDTIRSNGLKIVDRVRISREKLEKQGEVLRKRMTVCQFTGEGFMVARRFSGLSAVALVLSLASCEDSWEQSPPALPPQMASMVGNLRKAAETLTGYGDFAKRIRRNAEGQALYTEAIACHNGCISYIRTGLDAGFDEGDLTRRLRDADAARTKLMDWYKNHARRRDPIRPGHGPAVCEAYSVPELVADFLFRLLHELLDYDLQLRKMAQEERAAQIARIKQELSKCECSQWSKL